MKKETEEKKEEEPLEILKIPMQLEEIKYRKMAQDWGLVFSVQPEILELIKPLMDKMNCHFIVAMVKVDDMEEVNKVMAENLEDLVLEK